MEGAESPKAPLPAQPPQEFFADFAESDEAPKREELLGLLEPVAGASHPGTITETKSPYRPGCALTGLFRLKGDWAEGTGLRLGLSQAAVLQMHFWRGDHGVTLRHYPELHKSWAAYGALREDNSPQPAKQSLWATDEGRYERCGMGSFEIRYLRGNLVMVRGDVTLLSVPFDGPPTEVFVQCTGQVRGLAFFQCKSVPPAPVAREPFLRTRHPAELPWDGNFPPATELRRLPNGQVELSADEKTEHVQAWTTVRRPGLYEYIFEVDTPDPGTGVYLGDEQGKPIHRVGFFRWVLGKQTTFELSPVWSNDTDKTYLPPKQIVPYAGRRQWLRLVMGAGIVKLYTSGDAVHWSQVAPKSETAVGACSTVGLYCLPGKRRRSIRLSALEVRQLDAVASVAPESVQQQVGWLVDAENLESWEKQVLQTQPSDVSADVWWRACVVRTLARASKGNLGQQLLDRLQERVVAEPGDPAQLLRFLEESTLLRSNDEWNGVDRVAAFAERLGLQLASQGERSPATVISKALLRLSFWTQRRLVVFSDELVRQELVGRIGEDRLDEARQFCQRMRFWLRPEARNGDPESLPGQLRHLLDWAEFEADGRLPERDRRLPQRARRRFGAPTMVWRHPLVERLSREGYNVLAEFQAALEGKAFREASQIISMSARAEGLGLLPDKRDSRLLVSMPVAVEAAMIEHPALRAAMQEQFGARSRLRLQQAINAGDAAGAEAVALQFYGTESAAAANRWLGDRALGAGRFAEAIGRYTAALRSAPGAEQEDLRARIRLAGAMAGVELGKPPSGAVQFGPQALSAGEFEALIAQARAARRAPLAGGAVAGAAPAQSSPAPGRYQARPWAQINTQALQRPGAVPERGIDWAGRQTSVVIAGNQMFVNNRVQQYAFDLPTGRQLWVHDAPARDQQWPLLRLRPAVAGGRVFVRRMSDNGFELVSLDAADGRQLWNAKPGGHVASDPLILGDGLFVLSASYVSPSSEVSLSLVELNPQSGQIVSQAPLAEFRDCWQRQIPCQATVATDRIVATVGGCVLSCEPSGRVQWLRRQLWIPPPGGNYWNARQWFEQSHDPPLVVDGRVYATQPGVWNVECLSLDTGRPIWCQSIGGLTGIVGRSAHRLLVEAGDQVVGLDLASGRPVWGCEVKNRLEAQLGGQPEMVVCVQSVPNKEAGKPPQLALVWVDPDTGRQRVRSVLDAPPKADPCLKPLVIHGGRQWAFFASAQEAAKREILELVRVGDEKIAAMFP